MKIYIISNIFLIFIIIISCKTTRSFTNKNIESISREIIDIISKDGLNGVFKQSNVILVDLNDQLKSGDFIFQVSPEDYLLNFPVRPDSIDLHINSFIEKNDKLFLFKGIRDIKKPSEVFSKIQSYGVELDSCTMKYYYMNYDPYKLTDCISNSEFIVPFEKTNSLFFLAKWDKYAKGYKISKISRDSL